MMGICMQLKELDWDENVYGYCFFSSFFYLNLSNCQLYYYFKAQEQSLKVLNKTHTTTIRLRKQFLKNNYIALLFSNTAEVIITIDRCKMFNFCIVRVCNMPPSPPQLIFVTMNSENGRPYCIPKQRQLQEMYGIT